MTAEIVFALSALLAQVAFGQVIGNSVVENDIFISNGYGLGAAGFGNGLGYGLGSGLGFGSGLGVGSGLGLGASVSGALGAGLGNGIIVGGLTGVNVGSSGPLIVTNISPIGPSGLAVASENAIEGVLAVSGQLPFLSAVAFEGALPTAGSGVATCGCGNGNVGIVSEGFPAGYGPGLVGAGLPYGAGLGLGGNLGINGLYL